MMSSSPEHIPSMEPLRTQSEILDIADKMIDTYMAQDNAFPSLLDKMRISPISGPTVSGLQCNDYPSSDVFPVLTNMNQFKLRSKVPLPPEILEQCCNARGGYMMGLFPDISRAWLIIDTDIYIWDFESGGDVAYYDALSDVIMSVGLVVPKPGVFQHYIKRLLILTTSIEVIVLGVTLSQTKDNKKHSDELQLTPDIIYSLTTDGVPITIIRGTNSGRIFMGGRDGSLFEIIYQKEMGFWGKRAKKVNHSRGALSYLLPSFLSSALYDEDPVLDIAIDNTRNIVYTLTEKGTIEVFDLGEDGKGMTRVASLSYSSLITHAAAIVNTLDPREIANIVSLCALDYSDSPQLNLVGVTSSGVRLYFAAGSAHPARPNTLQILHIRLPPGYSSNSACLRPSVVSRAEHTDGNFILVTTHKDAPQDKIWCLSSDSYPTRMWYSESCSVSMLSGQAVTLGLMRLRHKGSDTSPCPSVVYQHNIRPIRVVLLTQQGTEIFEKLRPMDILADLLRECSGPDSEIIKNYFVMQGADQGCANTLTLACNHSNTSSQMADWATRAFFLYGGDPRQVVQQQPTLLQYSLPPGFKPGTVSTPLGNKAVSPSPESYSIQMSSKHNGLYLYLCRILRPVWYTNIVHKVKLPDGKEYLLSKVHIEQLASISSQLLALRVFLEKNTQVPNSMGNQKLHFPETPVRDIPVTSPTVQRSRLGLQEAVIQEKKSLDSLKMLVDHATQVINFWRVMCDHQFHIIAATLPMEMQQQILNTSFRGLVMSGQELCSTLINKLINIYLCDNTSVDSISSKLREVCPSLYKSEDAACSKANEILQLAKDQQDQEEKLVMLHSAIRLCKEVSPHVDLSWVCKQLTVCKYYEGVLEVCQDAANKLDPNNLAHNYYSKNQPSEDIAGYKAYLNRLTAYKEVTQMLDHLHQHCQFSASSPLLLPGGQTNTLSQKVLQDVLNNCLDINDEVLHVVCYEWLIARNLHASLVTFGRPSLESYLVRYPLDPNLRDLLWQYHEKNGNHAAAAQLLYSLATTTGDSLKLHQRLTYLGKAVMCMRSDGAGCAPHLGVFLHELEDMVQVARVQKQVLDSITNLVLRDIRAEDAIRKLNSGLLTITELFEEYAEPFDLWECKLTILDCAGHEDRDLINMIWDNIIAEELSKCSRSSGDDQMTLIMGKIKTLGLQFTVKSPCFPLAYLVWQLETIACRLDVNKSHVHSVLTSIGVDVSMLLDVYDKMFAVNDRCWQAEGNEFHLIQVIASFADSFLANPRIVHSSERKAVAVRMQDLITNCLSTLYSKPDTKQLVSYLKNIQSNLNHI